MTGVQTCALPIYAWVNGNQSAMLNSIENLNATASGVPDQIDTLIETLNTTQTTLQADGVDIIKNVSVVEIGRASCRERV